MTREEKLEDLIKRSLDIIDTMNSSNNCRVCGWYKKPMSESHSIVCPLFAFWLDVENTLKKGI